MASNVDIANLALAHLGDTASVSSLDPPEGSAQADHCARFLPVARDALLQEHEWGFSSRRKVLAQVASDWPQWRYAYVKPADCLVLRAILPSAAASDVDEQPYVVESKDDGSEVIYTNQELAVARYSVRVSDSTKFTPLFVLALSWRLAALLAGPILKGDAGRAEAKRCEGVAQLVLDKATVSDASESNARRQYIPSSIAAR